MDMRNRLMSGLASIVLGSGMYVTSGCTRMLSVKVSEGYVDCDLNKEYTTKQICYAPVAEYRAAHPVSSSSSSTGSTYSSSGTSLAAERAQARAERQAELKAGGHWVCPTKK